MMNEKQHVFHRSTCLQFIIPHSSFITLSEQSAVVFGARGREARELEVLFDVRASAHADESGCDAGRGAHKLYRGLCVRRERAERLAYLLRQVRGDFALQYGGAGDDRHAERLRRFEQGDVRALIGLVLRDERFGHCEVEGELDEAEAVLVSARLARKLEQAFERVVAARALLHAEAVPRRHAVEPYATRRALAFELLEGGAQSFVELF